MVLVNATFVGRMQTISKIFVQPVRWKVSLKMTLMKDS